MKRPLGVDTVLPLVSKSRQYDFDLYRFPGESTVALEYDCYESVPERRPGLNDFLKAAAPPENLPGAAAAPWLPGRNWRATTSCLAAQFKLKRLPQNSDRKLRMDEWMEILKIPARAFPHDFRHWAEKQIRVGRSVPSFPPCAITIHFLLCRLAGTMPF